MALKSVHLPRFLLRKKLENHDDCLCQVVDVFSAINSDTRRKDTTNPLGEADSQCPQARVLLVKSIFYLKQCAQDCVQATFSARMSSQQITPAVQVIL